jgi:hypothetical protein
MIVEFLAGIIVGAASTVMVAKWFDDRPRTKAKPRGVATASLDMRSNTVPNESFQGAVARIF